MSLGEAGVKYLHIELACYVLGVLNAYRDYNFIGRFFLV
jgi:hypothetical protein